MTRRHHKPLAPQHARDLARGALREFRDGDTVETVAARLDLPVRRVEEALDESRRLVLSSLRRGATAETLASELGLPRAFVVTAIRRYFALRASRRAGDRKDTGVSTHERAWIDRRASVLVRGTGLRRREAVREARTLYAIQRQGRSRE